MIIKNNKDYDIDVLGVTINANDEMAISDIGSAQQLRLGTDEIVDMVQEGIISIIYADGTSETSVQKVVDILDNRIPEIIANALPELIKKPKLIS